MLRGDALPPLHGLPIGIKDLQETAGLVTTHGSVDLPRPCAGTGRTAGRRGPRGGAIVVGKTNTPEFGAGANTRNAVYGATGNPFDPAKSCAGSSGGSAVALATGMVPLCTGSDTGGSLRNPAAFCGIVGFRPTPGLVPSERRGLGWSNLSVLGPMARTVADLALLLSAMVGDDARDPLATTVHGATVRRAADFAVPAPIDLARLRVALTPDFGFAPTERHIAEVFAEKTGLFRQVFARAEDATPDCAGADEAFEVLRALGYPRIPPGEGAHAAAGRGPQRARQCRGGPALQRRRRGAGDDAADRDVPALADILRALRRDPDARHHDQSAVLARAVPGRDRRQADPHLFPLAGAGLWR